MKLIEEDISNDVNLSLKPGGLLSLGTGLKLNRPANEGGVSDMVKQQAGDEVGEDEIRFQSKYKTCFEMFVFSKLDKEILRLNLIKY